MLAVGARGDCLKIFLPPVNPVSCLPLPGKTEILSQWAVKSKTNRFSVMFGCEPNNFI